MAILYWMDRQRQRGLLAFARRYVLQLWPWYLGGILCLAATNAVTLAIPRFARDVVDALSRGGESSSSIPLVIIGLGALLVVIRVLSRILFFWPGRRLEADVRHDMFARILEVPRAVLRRFGQGDLVSRIANDTGYLRVLFAFGLLSLVNVAFLLAMTIVSMATVHEGLTLFSLLPFIPLLFLVRFLLPAMHAASRRYQESVGHLTTVMSETFRGLSSVRLHGATSAFLGRISGSNETVFQSSRRLAMLETVVFPMAGLMVNVSQAVVLGYGGLEVIAGRLTAGDIMVFNVYMAGLAFPLAFMGAVLALVERARSAEDRISEILELPVESGPVSLPEQFRTDETPLLEVRDLSFSWPQGFSLSGCSCTLPEKGRIGICGPVGSGKSLLFDLIMRFEQPPPGSVYVRGQDVLGMPVAELRRTVGYALQSARLLSDSIRNNLVFGLGRTVSDEELYEVLDQAALAREVRKFPDGLDTVTGEKGMRLSGGQRQRLALARLFLRRSSILLLDDILSAVDQSTESRLVDVLFNGSAAIMVASHRHAVLERCDEVLLMQDGKILDRGPYDSLAARHRRFLISIEKDKADGAD